MPYTFGQHTCNRCGTVYNVARHTNSNGEWGILFQDAKTEEWVLMKEDTCLCFRCWNNGYTEPTNLNTIPVPA